MTNEELSKKILNDIQYIKDNFELLQKRLADYQISTDTLNEIRSVLNFFRTFDFSFISTMDNQGEILNVENQFSPYKISMEAFIERSDLQQRRENFIANNKKMYEYMGTLIHVETENEASKVDKIEGPYNEIQDFKKRIEILEEEQKPLNEIIIKNEQNDKRYLTQIDEIKKSITDLQSSDSQIEINKMLMQTKVLFDEATNSKQLISDEVTEPKRAKEGHIAYELSIQLQNKSKRLGFQSFLRFVFFLGTIVALIAFNTEFVNIYLYKTASVAELIGEMNKLDFWQVMVLKLTMNILNHINFMKNTNLEEFLQLHYLIIILNLPMNLI
ncbi:MAG: hypothetical protein Q7S59_10500 [Sulfurimonas sp.]|nr:hypothetical protein [Sulfurimonas sp.]